MVRNKINIILVIWLSGYLVIWLVGCAKKEIKNINSKGTNIICFGDSITFGYGAERKEAYPLALAKMVDMPVINMGIDGDTSPEAIKRIETDVLDRDPLLVIIEFGGNDFLRKIPLSVTKNNVSQMVDIIQAKGAMVAIVDVSAGPLLKDYRKAFSNLAKEKKTIFIPHVFSGIITNPRLKSDFLHPNGQGYQIIAQRIYRAILLHLKENRRLREGKKN